MAIKHPSPVAEMSSARLVAESAQEAMNVVKAEIALAKIELRADLKSEVAAAKGLGVAAVCALVTLSLLAVSAALALSQLMPGWAAALLVAAVVALVGGVSAAFGWKHVKTPLARTRRSLVENMRWVKERTS